VSVQPADITSAGDNPRWSAVWSAGQTTRLDASADVRFQDQTRPLLLKLSFVVGDPWRTGRARCSSSAISTEAAIESATSGLRVMPVSILAEDGEPKTRRGDHRAGSN